jgi:hypothetical protein
MEAAMADIADLRSRWEKLCEELAKADDQRVTAMRAVAPMFAAVAAGGRENPSEAAMKAWDDVEARYQDIREQMNAVIEELQRR